MNKTPSVPSTTNDVSCSQVLVLAVGAASIWACLGFARGATLSEYVALFAGGALSLLLVQMALEAARAHAGGAARLLVTCGLAAVPIGLLGYWLIRHTNHRPLAAVTFAAASLAVFIGTFALVSPLRFALKPAASAAALVGLALLWPLLAGDFGFAPVVDVATGIALSAFVTWGVRRDLVNRQAKWGGGVASAMLIAACLFALTAQEGAAAAQKAPILAGIIGLLA